MQENPSQIRQIKTSIIALLITFLFVVSGIAMVTKRNHNNLFERDLKISALIDEVGELKQANDELYADTNKKNQRLAIMLKELNSLNKNFGQTLTQKEESLKKMQNVFQLTQAELHKLIADRDQTINALAQKNDSLKKELSVPQYSQDIIDVLIIGQNGGLTDSMILAGINPSTEKISMLSIPRDLYHKGRKINELYNLYGLEKLKEALYEISGITVDKYVIFDFDSFVTLVDSLGGIDINVAKDLVDNQYPGPNHTYKKVTFVKGLHHMDGQTALKYARSRKSTTDFDRSTRQQQLISSLKEKAMSLNLLQNLDAVKKIYDSISGNIQTDIGIFEAMAYFDKYRDFAMKNGNVVSNRNFLYSTVSKAGQYILLPVAGSYADLKAYVSDLVNG